MFTNSQLIEKLRTIFASRVDSPVIERSTDGWSGDISNSYGPILVSFVSPTFEGMDEGERQRIVWQCLLDEFDEEERRRIEFVYTDSPSERKEILADEAGGS